MTSNEDLVKDIHRLTDTLAQRLVIPSDMVKHLDALWGLIWIESCYDAYSDATKAFANKLYPHITAIMDVIRENHRQGK